MVKGAGGNTDEDNLTRKVTHSFKDYTLANQKETQKRSAASTLVPKEITTKFKGMAYEKPKSDKDVSNDKYITFLISGNSAPFWYGGFSFITVLCFLFSVDEKLSGAGWTIVILCSIVTIFQLIYFFTKPKKEMILDRLAGVITFPGFYWQENITMDFQDIIFTYSTGGENVSGAFQLRIMRPRKYGLNSFEPLEFGGGCYKSMSLVTWYMDKNRPLPPGSAFDPYRQQDYERRKAEGFPKPLYPSAIPTPEATKKQQVERKRIGGW